MNSTVWVSDHVGGGATDQEPRPGISWAPTQADPGKSGSGPPTLSRPPRAGAETERGECAGSGAIRRTMANERMYIQTQGDAGSRTYVRVEIVESGLDKITILVPDKKLNKCSHTELYHTTSDGTFVRQVFRVLKRKKHRKGVLLYLSQVGATKSAERRKHVRVPAGWIRGRFGDEEGCTMIDVSEQGLCIVSSEPAEVGASVPVVIEYDGTVYAGTARVQNVKELESGSYRYGTFCIGSLGDPDELSKALPRIAMQIQLLAPDPVGG